MDERDDFKIKLETNISKLQEEPNIQKIYTNAVIVFRSNSDVGIVCYLNGKPTAMFNMSFTLAKTLAQKIGQVITDLEEKTGTAIMTTSEIDKKMYTASEKKEPNNDNS